MRSVAAVAELMLGTIEGKAKVSAMEMERANSSKMEMETKAAQLHKQVLEARAGVQTCQERLCVEEERREIESLLEIYQQ